MLISEFGLLNSLGNLFIYFESFFFLFICGENSKSLMFSAQFRF